MTVPYYFKVKDAAGTDYPVRVPGQTAATNVRPTWVLNDPGSLDFDISTVDSDAGLFLPGKREVQLWYDNGVTPKCIWWGPVVARDCQGVTTRVSCKGLLSYTERIQLGPILSNYLLDPDFEDATLAHWAAGGTVTKSSDTAIVRKGTRSLKLVSSAQGLDNFATQTFTFDNTLGAEPIAIFVRARFYLTAVSGSYIGPAYLERGLFVQTVESSVVKETVWTPLNNSAPRNQWVRIFAPPVSIPAGHSQTVEVRCYSPGGTINWDTSIAAIDESIGANTVSTYADVNTIIGNTLTYAQDTAKNKTNFHLAGPSGTFGTTLSRQWQFYDHGFLWNVALKPLIDAGVMDVDVTWNAATPTTRTLTTYTTKGTTPGVTLTLGSGSDVSGYSEDSSQVAGAITVLPQGMQSETTLGTAQPAADDVAYAFDTSANAGIVFDYALSAGPESTLDQMDGQAATELARRKNLNGLPAFVTAADAWWTAGVVIGDTITLAGTYGWVGGTDAPLGSRRVVQLDLIPEANLMVVTGQ